MRAYAQQRSRKIAGQGAALPQVPTQLHAESWSQRSPLRYGSEAGGARLLGAWLGRDDPPSTETELYHLLTVERQWSARQYEAWVADLLDHDLLG
jgi:hypothetical protein